jgi:hypothetical protein
MNCGVRPAHRLFFKPEKSFDSGFCQFTQKNRQIPDLIDNPAGRGQPGYQ